MRNYLSKLALLLVAGTTANSFAAVTEFSDRSTFNLSAGSVIVEDFTSTDHFPITGGVLNSTTSLPGIGIFPGSINPGVTYSTPVGTGFFFNIDGGGGYSGGFLDALNDTLPDRTLTATFDGPIGAFGFDANTLMGNFTVDISFTSGPDYVATYPVSGMSFYGYQSTAADITSVKVHGDDGTFAFALDNFTYNGSPRTGHVPDIGSSLFLMTFGLLGVAAVRTRFAKA